MKRKGFLLALSLLIFLLPATHAVGATALFGSVYSGNAHFEPPFTNSDIYVMVPYVGVDSNSYDVYVQNIPGSSGDQKLNYSPGWDWLVSPNHLYSTILSSPSPGSDWWDRNYTFYVDENGNAAWDAGEPTLDKFIPKNWISQMDVVQNVSISDGVNPIIEWDNVAHAYEYFIRIVPIVGDNPDMSTLLFASSPIRATESRYSYQYEGDLFETYNSLTIVIEANEYHPSGGVGNRSRHFSEHVVPIPGAIWLLGSGLICLVGIRRKLTKN